MGTTVIGSGPANFPFSLSAPIIETAATWNDDWQLDTELEFLSMMNPTGSQRAAEAQFIFRFGQTKYPEDLDLSTARTPRNILQSWVRVSFIDADTGQQVPQFIGIIDAENREVRGNVTPPGGSDPVPTGIQTFVASGGLRILERIELSRARFNHTPDDNTYSEVGWLPPMNERGKHNLLVGNRSSNHFVPSGSVPPTFMYGGKQVWTHLQYAQYLIANFVQQADSSGTPTGPIWTIGGQIEILSDLQTAIKFPESVSIAQMLKELINPKWGVDFIVETQSDPNDSSKDGFQITVFSQLAVDTSAAGVTIPKNPNTVPITRDGALDLVAVNFVKSNQLKYDKIELIGKRIVVCGTMRGAGNFSDSTSDDGGGEGDSPDASLTGLWSPTLETLYTTAEGTTTNTDYSIEDGDEIRRKPKYDSVFQYFGAPSTWDMSKGIWSVQCNDDGSLTDGKTIADQFAKDHAGDEHPSTPPKTYQTSIRETLHWLPLQQGFDYTTSPPTDNTLSAAEISFVPLQAWIHDDAPIEASEIANTTHFVSCNVGFKPSDTYDGSPGMHVGPLPHEWGVFLGANPNHLLALNTWTDTDTATSDHDPRFDYQTLVATVAIESDHRLRLASTLPPAMQAGDGSIMTVHDAEAECWVLLPQTIVDVGKTGDLLASANEEIYTLRKDLSRLALVMAGIKARYINERSKAKLTFNGYLPWANLLGHICTILTEAGQHQDIGAPITLIEWEAGTIPRTRISIGYA